MTHAEKLIELMDEYTEAVASGCLQEFFGKIAAQLISPPVLPGE